MKGKEAKKQNFQFRGRIAVKIILSIIMINVIALSVVGGSVVKMVKVDVGSLSRNYAESQVKANVNEIDQSFKSIESLVQGLSADIGKRVDVTKGKQDISYLRDLCDDLEVELSAVGKQTQVTDSIYVIFDNKLFGDVADCWVYSKDFVREETLELDYFDDYYEWYNKPVDEGITEWTLPYAGTTTVTAGMLLTSYVTPIKKGDQIIGMIGMDLNLADISENLSSVKLYDTGYLYMLTPDGNVVVHPRISWEDTDNDGYKDTSVSVLSAGDYQFLLDDMTANDHNVLDYKRDDGVSVIAAYEHLSNGWIIGSSIPEDEANKIDKKLISTVFIIAIASAILSILIAILIGRSISKPIRGVVKAVNRMKEGDFTAQVHSRSNDETRILAESVNEMADHVRNLIRNTKKAATELVDSSVTLASMSEETNATIEQVASTVAEISKGTQDTAEQAEKSAHVVNVLDSKFNSVLENSDTMHQTTEEVSQRNKSGMEALTLLKDASKISQNSNKKITDAVQKLDSRTNAISGIISTINSIADQTNLLALNASVEAARAGEAGRGFAVVAGEIRKLAEDSRIATDKIREIVQAIQKDSKETVQVMDEVNSISEKQNQAVDNVNESFDMIFKAIEGITSGIDLVTNEMGDLNSQKNEIVDVTSNISAVSEETAAATEEVNATMEQQKLAIDEVSKNAEILNHLALKLNEYIEVFKV